MNGFVLPPRKDIKFTKVITQDYRSLYPEPFEIDLTKYNINIDTLYQFIDDYDVIKQILNKKMNANEYSLYKSDFILALININAKKVD
jgi:hypothetical protein